MADLDNSQLLALSWSLGWRVAAALVLGYYADLWLGTAPWLMLALALAALVSVVRGMLTLLSSEKR